MMKLKLLVVLCSGFGYLIVTFGAGAASELCSSTLSPLCAVLIDGTNPPHAVDITGKEIPASSVKQPDKPIILAKDSKDASRKELKPEAAFDHVKHSTEAKYSADGKSAPSCVECHHTDQPPPAPKGQEYLKTFNRNAILTTQQLETSKLPVHSCRTCHFQEATPPTSEYPPQSVKYPNGHILAKRDSGLLDNFNAYHNNCRACHLTANKKRKLKAPTGCNDCHVVK